MTREELVAAWRAAKEATQEAKRAILRAEERLREAQAHHLKMWDAERFAWVKVKDAEWEITTGKDGKPDGIRRVPIGVNDNEL